MHLGFMAVSSLSFGTTTVREIVLSCVNADKCQRQVGAEDYKFENEENLVVWS